MKHKLISIIQNWQTKTFIVVLVLIFSSTNLLCQISGTNDATFNPGDFGYGYGDGANGNVWTSAIQTDGKIIIAGEFTSYNGTNVNRIARLNSDGTLDPTFNVGFGANIGIRKIVIQTDGKIIIGGAFTNYNGSNLNRIARLNSDGTIDGSFVIGSGLDSTVHALAIQNDGKILVGGVFLNYNGVSSNRILRLNTNGTIDAGFSIGSGSDNLISSISVQSDNKIIVSGMVSNFNGTICNKILRLNPNGSADNTFIIGAGANGVIRSTSIQDDGKIIIGGTFTSFNGTLINRIARLNANGSIDLTFNIGNGPNNSAIWSTNIQSDGKIIIGGDFTSYNGTPINRIVRLNSNGSIDAAFTIGTGASGIVLSVEIQSDDKIIIAGDVLTYDGTTRNYITRLNANGSLDPIFNMGSSANNSIYATAIQPDGKIIIGGDFTRYSGTTINRIVRINMDGSLDGTFLTNTGTDASVRSIAIQNDGKIIIAGSFTNYNNSAFNRIARLNTNGTYDLSFTTGSGFNGTINSTSIQSDGKVIVCGEFTNYNGTPINRIARLDINGSLDPTFNVGTGVNNSIYSSSIQSDGKIIIAGNFTDYNGILVNRIVRLNTNGTIDNSFNTGTGANNIIYTTSIQMDGKIIIGGNFTSLNSFSYNKLARLNTNGTIDNSFDIGIGPNLGVMTTSIQNDAKIIIGGIFTTYNGISRNHIMRLNADGSLDMIFNSTNGANNNVYSTAIQNDDKIIIAGQFTEYNTTGRNRIARINVCDGSENINGLTTICQGSSSIYSVTPISGALSYSWSLTSGWAGSSTTNTISITTNANSGTVSVSVIKGCGLTAPASLFVNINPLPSVAATNGTICIGNSFTIVPSGANTYTFSSGSNIVAPLSNTTYTITGTDFNGCENFALSQIAVNSLPIVSASDGFICNGNTFTITPNGANSYTISNGSTNIVNPSTTTNYTITGTDINGCENFAIITVTVNSLPNIQVSTNNALVLCAGETATLTATGGISYDWYPNGPMSINTNSIVISPTITTTYTVEGTDANGCINYAIITQSINPLPIVQVSTSNTLICVGETSILTASGGMFYDWFPDGPMGLNTNSIVISPTVSTTYTVEGIDNNGCKNYAIITQSVSLCTSVEENISINKILISVFPNPAKDIINIQSISDGVTTIEITDILGKIVFTEELFKQNNSINIENYSNGLYIIKASNKNQTQIIKLIKQ